MSGAPRPPEPADRALRNAPARRIRSAVVAYDQKLVAYATGILKEQDAARDATQETFVRLCKHIDTVPDGRIAPWLFKVCRNVCFDRLRKRKRMERLDTDKGQKTAAAAAPSVEDLGTALQAMQKLPANQREVLQLKFLHELSYREIAEVTELSVSHVGFLIHVGLKGVRRTLKIALPSPEKAQKVTQ